MGYRDKVLSIGAQMRATQFRCVMERHPWAALRLH